MEDVIAHLRDHATEDGERLGMMGDDGEKFGAWPTTWEHCWGATRWIDRFFEALEANADWLTTTTPSDWLDRHPPIGRVYLPTASYAEMGEWALPAATSRARSPTSSTGREAAAAPEYRYLRGGFWRNFQVKYREVNDLHKQMLRTSAKVAAMPEGPAADRARDHLYQGQSNDCYWHGLFGGIYISHMRLATYEHLIAAEDAADAAARTAGRTVDGVRVEDVDLDGVPEIVMATPGQVVVVKPSEGAGIGSWDIRAVRHALAAVMRRRPEASHETLVEHESKLAAHGGAGDQAGGVGSIHEMVTTKETGLAERLHYDAYERRSGLVRLFAPGATPGAYARADIAELGDFVAGAFRLEESEGEEGGAGWIRLVRDGTVATPAGVVPVRVEKAMATGGDRRTSTLTLEVRVQNRGETPFQATLAVEWALTMLGGGGNPAAYYLLDGERLPHDAAGSRASLVELRSGNDWIGVDVATRVAPPAETWISPIDTVSNSEAGFERVYQGSALVFSWPIDLAPGATATVRVEHVVTTSKDRAAEEGGATR